MPAMSSFPISTADEGSILALEFAFSRVIKWRDSCIYNVLILFLILLSWVSILRIRFRIRTLFHIRTAAITNAPTANVVYSTVIRRQSARSAISHNFSYSTRPSSARNRQ
jgi:cell division protein FtsL